MENKKVEEIDLLRLLGALLKRIWIIVISAVLCMGIGLGYAKLLVPVEYESRILVYVNNSSLSIGSASFSISSGELTAAQKLVDTYLVILKSHSVYAQIRERAGVEYSDSKLGKMISAAAVNKTEIFHVTVTANDPAEAQLIANTIAEVFPGTLSSVVNGSSVKIIDYALLPTGKSGPSLTRYALIGFLIGLVGACGVIIVLALFDDKINDENTLTQLYKNIPVLASVPCLDMSARNSGKYGKYGKYAKYGRYGKYGKYGKYGNNEYDSKSAYEHASNSESDGR